MPTYVYETIPEKEGEAPKTYEFWQHMRDEPFERHPETGERIRRIIIGGLVFPEPGMRAPEKHPPPHG